MKRKIAILLIILLAIGILIGLTMSSCKDGRSQSFEKDEQIKELIDKMSLQEKVGQMTQITLEVIVKKDEDGQIIRPLEIDPDKLKEALVAYKVGSVINTGGAANQLKTWHKIISTIQQTAMNKTDKQIPVLYGIDAIHGANYIQDATLFPQQIAQAASFNRTIVKKAAEVTAYETRASGVPWNFSPVLGIGKEPLWPRFWETFGEDTYLASVLGKAMVKGYQGEDISDTTRVAACMKHYMGYSEPETGKDRTPAIIPERELRQDFLPPFKKAVEAGNITAMVNSGEINGTPAHADKHIITDILKEEVGMKGLVVTDWQDIIYLHTRHKVAPTMSDAIKMAINAGIDMSMVPHEYKEFADLLIKLVEEGKVSEERIDDAVHRILYVKKELGLWEHPVTHYKGYTKFASEEFQETSLKAAREGAVLLANKNNTLPLDANSRLLVTGPTANSMVPLNGGWSYVWQGTEADKYAEKELTVLEALEETFQQVDYVKGADYQKVLDVDKARASARNADAIVLALGESSYCETPGNIDNLNIPEAQQQLAKAMAETGKPVILLLLEGRPRIISSFAEDMDAVLMANLLGNKGGVALAEILSGEINPSGKLPFTYPRYCNALVPYNHKHTQSLNRMDGTPEFNPQYEFGHGLSYTSFAYTGLSLDKEELSAGEQLNVSVEVKNTGDRKGKEAVLLFLRDHYATITPAVKKLRGFKKIELEPGESRNVKFTLDKDDLTFVNNDLEHVVEAGKFSVMVNDQKAEFEWK